MTVIIPSPNHTITPVENGFKFPKEAEALVNRRIRLLIGKPLMDRIRRDFFNQEMTDARVKEVQNLLDIRWRALIVEYDTLLKINSDLSRFGIALTGLQACRDTDDPNRLAVVPVIKELA